MGRDRNICLTVKCHYTLVRTWKNQLIHVDKLIWVRCLCVCWRSSLSLWLVVSRLLTRLLFHQREPLSHRQASLLIETQASEHHDYRRRELVYHCRIYFWPQHLNSGDCNVHVVVRSVLCDDFNVKTNILKSKKKLWFST